MIRGTYATPNPGATMGYPAERQRDLAVSALASTIGREHIRLSYEYLNRRDVEGYASLVDPMARFRGPGPCLARGRRRQPSS